MKKAANWLEDFMDSESVREIVNTLLSNLEKLETQTEALTQFMKEKKKVTDAQLAPYLEKAGKASDVRWRAARVRIEYLLAAAEKNESRQAENREPEKKEEVAMAKASGMEQAVTSDSSPRSAEKETKPQPELNANAADNKTGDKKADGKNIEYKDAESAAQAEHSDASQVDNASADKKGEGQEAA